MLAVKKAVHKPTDSPSNLPAAFIEYSILGSKINPLPVPFLLLLRLCSLFTPFGVNLLRMSLEGAQHVVDYLAEVCWHDPEFVTTGRSKVGAMCCMLSQTSSGDEACERSLPSLLLFSCVRCQMHVLAAGWHVQDALRLAQKNRV